MSGRSSKSQNTCDTRLIYVASKDGGFSEELPVSEWSSYEDADPDAIRNLMAKGQFFPGDPDICSRYIPMSDSDVHEHMHYKFPGVLDPGIEAALLEPEPSITYPDDGRELYTALCAEMNTSPIGLFYRNLLKEEMNLSYYGISEKGMRAIAIALRFNRHVRSFNLTDNFLKDDACFHLGDMLKTNYTLKELNLSGCRIGLTGMLRLGKHIRINRSLKNINLSKNCLTDEGGALFVDQMFYGATLERVNLSHNTLSTKTAEKLTVFMGCKNCLTHLDLSWNTFTHTASLVAMLNRIGDSERIEELNMSWNTLEGTNVSNALYKILLIPTLRVLNLSNNILHGEPLNMILAGLPKAKHLRTFDLSFNPLSLADAVSVIMKMLRPRVKIEELLLENVSVNKQFLVILERVKKMKFRENLVLTYGDLVRNFHVKEPDARQIILRRAQYLGHNIHPSHKVDVAVYFLKLSVEFERSILVKDLKDRSIADHIPLDEDLLTELSYVFPGPKIAGSRSVNLNRMREYIHRLWPDKKPTSHLHPHQHVVVHHDAKSREDVVKKNKIENAENVEEDNVMKSM